MTNDSLTDFIQEVTGESHLRIEDDLGDGFVRLRSAEAERRQAKHDIRSTEDILIEMLRNARDAQATHIFVAVSREGSKRRIAMIDDGCGIPKALFERIFEARVTSKLDTIHMDTWGVHGRGMALYAIQVNAEKAYVADSCLGGGSSFVIETDTTSLPEKTDQSSQPNFIRQPSGTITIRGPKNINRCVSEFSYIDKQHCKVFLGSPTEIAATLWEFGRRMIPAKESVFTHDVSSLALCERLTCSDSPEDFVRIAHGIGLELSSRSARRIMDGSMETLCDMASQIIIHDEKTSTASSSRRRSTSDACAPQTSHDEFPHPSDVSVTAITLSESDKEFLSKKVLEAWEELAQSYYLEDDIDITLRVQSGALHIRIPLIPQDE